MPEEIILAKKPGKKLVMHIIVHDTISILQPLFTLRVRPKVLFAQAQEPLFGPRGLHSLRPKDKTYQESTYGGYAVMQAAKQDGYEVMLGQQIWGLFDPGRSKDASDWQFAQFQQDHILEMLSASLHTFAEILPVPVTLTRLACLLLPADPTNHNLMVMNHGMSGFAGLPGFLLLQLWPSPGNLARVGPLLVRLFVHNLRWALTSAARAVTLGDILVLEGLSAAFISTLFPDLACPPWLIAMRPADDWQDALSQVARLHGVASYDEVKCNVYGMQFYVGDASRSPQALPMEPEEREYACELTSEALTITDARLIAAYLYGDELVALNGHSTVGLPPYAGFEVGYRLVQTYLQRSGQSLVQAMATSSREILAL